MKQLLFILFALISTGCASIPPVTLTYFQPKAQITAEATQTVTCKKSSTGNYTPFSISKVKLTESYISDFSKTYTLNFKELDGFFNDAEIEIDLTPDGRLANINGSSTGIGKMIIDTTAELAANFAKMSVIDSQQSPTVNSACSFLVAVYGEQPQTFVRKQTFDSKPDPVEGKSPVVFTLTANGNAPEAIMLILPTVTVTTSYAALKSKEDSLQPARKSIDSNYFKRVRCSDDCSKYTHISLPSHTAVSSVAWVQKTPIDPPLVLDEVIYLFPKTGESDLYQVPLFDNSAFGKLTAKIDLGAAGEIKKIKYASSDSNTGGEALKTIAGAFAEESEYEKLKAANDLAYEQQRQVACAANPNKTECK